MRKIIKLRLADGCTFLGHFENGKREGVGIKTYPNGATFEGIYHNDARHGTGIKTHVDGTKVKAEYIHGVKQ
jgi:hypothetical protein